MPEPRRSRRWKLMLASLAVAFLLAAFLTLWSPQTLSQPESLAPVVVTNFPDIQEVEGSVSIRGLVPHTRFVEPPQDTVVSPVERTAVNQLVDGGVLATDGFRHVVLSLSGLVKGTVGKPGRLGAVLIPDVEMAQSALLEDGLYLFPLEVTADLTPGSTFVASDPVTLPVAFPRYRVYFYNGSDRAVGARLFSYLSY